MSCSDVPRMDDCIDQVGSAKFIRKFDILREYCQVPLPERAGEISAFMTPSCLYSLYCDSFRFVEWTSNLSTGIWLLVIWKVAQCIWMMRCPSPMTGMSIFSVLKRYLSAWLMHSWQSAWPSVSFPRSG